MGNTATGPFECCVVHPHIPETKCALLKTASNKIQLAVSPLGGIPGFMAYHTSIVIEREEFYFSPLGLVRNYGLQSHARNGAKGELATAMANKFPGHHGSLRVIEVGTSAKCPEVVYSVLAPLFSPGSYDMLLKNCNAFTDVALYYLLGQRLHAKYNAIEKIGANNIKWLESLTGGAYLPNPRAANFDVEELLRTLEDCDACGPVGPRMLPQGTVARVTDLKTMPSKYLNDKPCVVERFVESTGRYEVQVGGELKALKPENLEPFMLEQEFLVTGLKTEAATYLNGERCSVYKFNEDTERLEVKMQLSGELKALKLENIQDFSQI